MSPFGYALAGAGQGLGQSIAGIGAQMGRDAEAAERERLYRERQEEADARRMERERELFKMRQDAAASRAHAGGGSSLASLAGLDQEQLARLIALGGVPGQRASEIAAVMGGTANDKVLVRDDQTGATEFNMPRYEPGQAAEMAQQGFEALRRAAVLTKPDAADDVAEAQGSEQVQSLVDKYAGGDTQAGRAALAAQGKGSFGAGGDDQLTGSIGPVSQARVSQARAAAGASSASAAKSRADAKATKAGASPDKERIRFLQQERLGAENLVRELRAQYKAATDAYDDTRAEEISGQIDTAMQRLRDVNNKLASYDGGDDAPRSKDGKPVRVLRFDRQGNLIK